MWTNTNADSLFIKMQPDTHSYSCKNTVISLPVARSAGAAEYTNWISAKWIRLPNECPDNDTKKSDGEVSVMLEL